MDKYDVKAQFDKEISKYAGDKRKGYCMAEIAAYILTRCTSDEICAQVMGDNHDLDTIADKFMDAAEDLQGKAPAEVMDFMSGGALERMADDYFGISEMGGVPSAPPAPKVKTSRFKGISLDDD